MSMTTKLLLIENQENILKILETYLQKENFEIIVADDVHMGLRMLLSLNPDIVVFDLWLSDLDGKELIKKIRDLCSIPIIICSFCDDDRELVAALNSGADDYVVKPFNPEVLLARMRATLRRSLQIKNNSIKEFLSDGPIKIYPLKHEIYINDKLIFFSPKEYNLLKYFMVHKGKILSHREILQEIWGKAYVNEYQYLRVQIGHVRNKICKCLGKKEVIHTEPGIGYRLQILDG